MPQPKLHIIGLFIFYAMLWLPEELPAPAANREHSDGQTTAGRALKTSPVDTTNQLKIRLLQPDSASQVTTFMPKFTWQALRSDQDVEYRLLIAKTDGKIIFDQWVGSDTSYQITTPGYFEDLTPYYWTVYASVNKQQVQSQVWSFWVDQDIVTDLTVTDMELVNHKQHWQPGDEVKINATIQNSGPIEAQGCYVTLYSGNINANYFRYPAYRKTAALDTVAVSRLKMNQPVTVTLRGKLLYGFNHLFVVVRPWPGLKDVIASNNFIQGIKIQTENRILSLKGLFVIYPNYQDPEAGIKRLSLYDIEQLYQNIIQLQQYFWDHTYILDIQADTIYVNRLLTDDNFTYQDERWGYFLSPEPVVRDLSRKHIRVFDYDFIFVYYSWWNSGASWTGYCGYSFKNYRLKDKSISFLGQPVAAGKIGDETTAIHEFLHLLQNLFQESGEPRFYSPHFRTLYTTFETDADYFDWMLETWQTSKWFKLNRGQALQRDSLDSLFKTSRTFHAPRTIILSPNYPNPFNKVTTINYQLPQSGSDRKTLKVTLTIYDVLGNRVRTLVNTRQPPGTYRSYWDGRDSQGHEIASGIYFYELRAGKNRRIRKMLYLH